MTIQQEEFVAAGGAIDWDHYPIDMLVLSHSSRSSYRSCARKLEFRQMYGSSPLDKEEAHGAEVGKCLHKAFQAWLIDKDERNALLILLQTYPYHLEYEDSKNSGRSLEACYYTLMAMIRSGIFERYELVYVKANIDGKIEDRPAVEVPIAFKITGVPSLYLRDGVTPMPVWFVGFIDCILYDRETDRYLVVDIKTTRMWMKDTGPKYEFDEQVVPYGIALEHALGHEIVEFDAAYMTVRIDLENPTVELHKFPKTKTDITDWHRSFCNDLSQIVKFFNAQWWPRTTNGDTCAAYNEPARSTRYVGSETHAYYRGFYWLNRARACFTGAKRRG